MSFQVLVAKKKHSDGSPAFELPRVFAVCPTVGESDTAKERGAAELVNFDKDKFGYNEQQDYWYAKAADGLYWFYGPSKKHEV